MSEENIAVARRVIEEAWNQGKLEVIDELADEGFVGHDPAAGGEFDREGGKQQIQMYRSAFPDLHFEIEDAFASGDKVAVRWRSEGTFENELMGLEPTHQKGTITGIGIDRIEDGKVVESWNQGTTCSSCVTSEPSPRRRPPRAARSPQSAATTGGN
jgi:predicted ester cyclase